MDYKKPQSTLVQGGVGLYPLTTADQVILSDGSRLEKDGKIIADSAADSAKLGGKAPEYYLQPRNLLDNSDFTNLVAQAGIGGNHGTVAYAADRWILDSGTVSYDAGVGLTLNGTISQKLESQPAGQTSAFVGMVSGEASISYADGAVTITSSGGVIKWAALYEGSYTADTKPPYVPKGYAAELAECQRYFWRMKNSNNWGIFAVGWEHTSTDTRYIVHFPVQMRIKPSVAYAGNFCVTVGTSDVYEVNGMSVDSFSGTYIQLGVKIKTQSIVKNRLSKLTGYNDSTSHIDFIADL